MWDSEKKFAHYIMNRLHNYGFSTTRIESGSTAVGIPDLYVMGAGDDYFIEFKNMKCKSIHDDTWKVSWRPGQQAWAQEYALHHVKLDSVKFTWTFVGLSDGVLLISMRKQFLNNIVSKSDSCIQIYTLEQFRDIDIKCFLKNYTYIKGKQIDFIIKN